MLNHYDFDRMNNIAVKASWTHFFAHYESESIQQSASILQWRTRRGQQPISGHVPFRSANESVPLLTIKD